MSRPRLLLFAGGACLERHGVLVRSTSIDEAGGYTVARSGATATGRDRNGYYVGYAANVPRAHWLDIDGSGVLVPTLLAEADADTNSVLYSTDTEGAAWTGGTGWTKTTATSLFPGSTARSYENDGVTASNSRYQILSTLGSAVLVASVIIENVDALVSSVGIYDATAGSWVVRADYTWATDAVVVGSSSAGSSTGARVQTLAEVGPNGGKVVRITAYGTPNNSGNTERVYFFPTGPTGTNALTAIIHHVQRETGSVATSPIVTAGSTVQRNAETIDIPIGFGPQELTLYVDLWDSGWARSASAFTGDILTLGRAGSGNGFVQIDNINSTSFRVVSVGSSGTITAYTAVTSSAQQRVELAVTISSAFAVGGQYSVAGGTTGSLGSNANADGMPTAWAANNIRVHREAIRSIKIAACTHTLAEMRDA